MSDYYAGCYTPAQMRTFAAPIRGPLPLQDVVDAEVAAGTAVECDECGAVSPAGEAWRHRYRCPAQDGAAGYHAAGDPEADPPAGCTSQYAREWQGAQAAAGIHRPPVRREPPQPRVAAECKQGCGTTVYVPASLAKNAECAWCAFGTDNPEGCTR